MSELPSREVLSKYRRCLPVWFHGHRRALPWRSRRTPYRVWVAEIMLQQTRVDQALPYYRRFLRHYPSLKSLAAASQQEVLKVWEGLGYYRRARSMHRAAREVVSRHGGRFPRDIDGLKALPGIGAYTAAAIGSLAMGLDAAVVDGNVTRVLSRIFAVEQPVTSAVGRRTIRALADALLPTGQAALFNEALMELGALCCLPRNPTCAACPLRTLCRAFAQGRATEFPLKGKKAAVPHRHVGAAVTVNARRLILIAQRREQDLLGGLWEFPGGKREPGENLRDCIRRELAEELAVQVRVGAPLITVAHAFSHFTMELHAYWCRIDRGRPKALECKACAWVSLGKLATYPMGKADQVIRARLEELGPDALRRAYDSLAAAQSG